MKTPRKNQNHALTAIAEAVSGIICHPTGAGKTNIEIWSIQSEIEKVSFGFCISAIIGPKIILMQQLMQDAYKELVPKVGNQNKEIMFSAIHSGRDNPEELNELYASNDMAELDLNNFTSVDSIVAKINSAKTNNCPIVFTSTYHSAERLVQALDKCGEKASIVNFDEAHHLGGEESNGQFSKLPEQFSNVANKQFYFTATPVRTASKSGTGMENSKFGKMISLYKPSEAILDGYILRPRVMLLNVDGEKPKKEENGEYADGTLNSDVSALIDGFDALRRTHDGKIAPKMIATMRGSKHLKGVVKSEKFKEYCALRPNLHTFEILSGHSAYTWGGAKIDGKHEKERRAFLSKLNEICSNPTNEVIVFHYDILTEGIDLSGVTGVMLFRQLNKTKLIQLLGRAARIYRSENGGTDDNSRVCREFQENGSLKTGKDFDHRYWLKPYAWIIVPSYGELGEDMSCMTYEMIEELRRYDFDPYRDIVIHQAGSTKPAPTLEQVNTLNEKKVKKVKEHLDNLSIEIEKQEIADMVGEFSEKIAKGEMKHYFLEF